MFGNRFSDNDVFEWRREKKEVLEKLDLKVFKPFYGKWVARGLYPTMLDDTLLEVEMYRQAADCEKLPTSRREEAKDWLRHKGYREGMA